MRTKEPELSTKLINYFMQNLFTIRSLGTFNSVPNFCKLINFPKWCFFLVGMDDLNFNYFEKLIGNWYWLIRITFKHFLYSNRPLPSLLHIQQDIFPHTWQREVRMFPRGNFPEGSFPVGSFPVGSFPVGCFPVGSFPEGSFPEGQFPRRKFPRRSVSQKDIFPDDSFPEGSFPEVSYLLANKLSSGKLSFWETYLLGNFLLGNWPSGKLPTGKLPSGKNPLGNYLWETS